MSEIFYYHLTESRLEQALPGLLERSLERGWNVVVQSGDEKQLNVLDEHLWTFRDDSFLPHGVRDDGTGKGASEPSEQPIWITASDENPNSASIRFLVHGASLENMDGYTRIVRMFDGHDPDAVTSARERWKVEKDAGHELTYWQQGEGGGWEKKA